VLYLTYGVLAGIGLGFGYIVPVATLVKWFPDKRGMITGIAVAGFGGGALVTAPIATRLIESRGVLPTFAILGVIYLIMVAGAALLMRNPPEGYRPPGWEPSEAQKAQRSARDYTVLESLGTWQWYALWALLFLNVTAGIAIISQAAPMAEEITGVSALTAAGLVGIISIANGSGRFLWAWLSDFIGRKWVFLTMFLIQAVVFFLLPRATTFGLFAALAFIVLLCYGGGFGTMPAFACRLLRAQERRLGVRPDADRLGRGRHRRADPDRQDPRVHRRVQQRALCDLGDHAGQCRHPVHRAATPVATGSRRRGSRSHPSAVTGPATVSSHHLNRDHPGLR
jgi:predicted MFS family arabinose efflux permease